MLSVAGEKLRHVPLNGSAGRLGFRLCGSQVDDVINRFDVFGPHVVLKNLYAQGAHKKNENATAKQFASLAPQIEGCSFVARATPKCDFENGIAGTKRCQT